MLLFNQELQCTKSVKIKFFFNFVWVLFLKFKTSEHLLIDHIYLHVCIHTVND